ncbi:unnamed protein product [Echinostoma caproni]|uniref:E3 ubiquitin-protein ligase HECW2 n=1 Tax=Echinostoma caproni TaxID=27848 RepID=A0A183A4B0_9TREM|nr:unnamed protein product [Echinostoma caproni]
MMQRDGNQLGAQSGSAVGSSATGGSTGPSAGSSEALLEQLASSAAMTTGQGGANQPGGPRSSIGSPRTPQSGVRAKVSYTRIVIISSPFSIEILLNNLSVCVCLIVLCRKHPYFPTN